MSVSPAITRAPASALALALALPLVLVLSACSSDTDTAAPPPPTGPVTFTKHVAPIIHAHCAPCHRPGEAGPFPLLTYDDVRSHASQIVRVTQSGFMPPWLPEPGYAAFVGDRRLPREHLDTLRAWVDGGRLEGDPADLPPLPAWSEGWQLGTPDLVVALPGDYVLPADGTDVFRNFVMPVPLAASRFVRAVELRPGNPQVVHHAIVMADPTGRSRRVDAEDPVAGYAGMDAVHGIAPGGRFLGWTPGRVPDDGGGSIPWRLDPGTDLVLQLHMVPSGKPEPIEPRVGLYFGDPPRTAERTFTLYMKAAVDIPPGAKNHVVTDVFVLPVDAVAERAYPHAHYLGTAIEAYATLPDGTRAWLMKIDDWDFNWQDAYRYAAPIALPRGSTITMRWTYDNSADNPRNPSRPPVRVVAGNRTTDEMAHLYLQLRVADEAARTALAVAQGRQRLQRFPNEPEIHVTLAGDLQALGDLDGALHHARRAVDLSPNDPAAHFCLALVDERRGRIDAALKGYREVVRLEPGNALFRMSLAESLTSAGRLGEAEREIAEARRLDPNVPEAYTLLGNVRRLQQRDQEAIDAYAQALEARPDDLRAHTYLAVIYTQYGHFEPAIAHLQQAIRIQPRSAALHSSLGRVLEATGRRAEASAAFRRALEIEPGHAEASAALRALGG